MTTVTLTLLGAGVLLLLAGLQDKSIVETYKNLLAGKPLDLGTAGNSNPSSTPGSGGMGIQKTPQIVQPSPGGNTLA